MSVNVQVQKNEWIWHYFLFTIFFTFPNLVLSYKTVVISKILVINVSKSDFELIL